LIVLVCLVGWAAACGNQAGSQRAGAPVATATPPHTVTGSPAGRVTIRPASIPPGHPPPTLAGAAMLTRTDNGATVRVRPGQRVTVALVSEGLFSWHVPGVEGAAVTRVSSGGGYPGRQPARATFLAVQPGSAALTALDDTACLHAQPACEPAQQEWRVTVIVTGG
jgi:hypothetical protein